MAYGEPPKKTGPGKVIAIVASLLVLIAIVLGAFFILKGKNTKAAEETAAGYEAQGNYVMAKEEYDKLYAKTGKDTYRRKRDEMQEYENCEKLIDEGETFVRGANYRGAISAYNKIPPTAGPVYQKARSRIDGLVKSIATELNGLLDRGDYAVVAKSARDYLSLVPGDPTLTDIKAKAEKGLAEKEAKKLAEKDAALAEAQKKAQDAEEAAAAAKAEAEKAKAQKKSETKKKSSNMGSSIVGTWQYVTAGEANVRSGPGKGYSSLYTLRRGDAVYVWDTSYDGTRTWCNIGDGWISYRTLNGEIR